MQSKTNRMYSALICFSKTAKQLLLQSWLLGKISSNVFTIAGTKVQSHNWNSCYQLGPTVRSITIHKSQTVFSSASEIYNILEKKNHTNRTQNLNTKGVNRNC